MPHASRHPLFLYASRGDLALLQECLQETPSVARLHDSHGHTPLMRAAEQGHHACLEALLPLSFPNRADPTGFKALHLTAGYRHLQCFDTLLDHCLPLPAAEAYALAQLAAAHGWEPALRRLVPLCEGHVVHPHDLLNDTLLMTALRHRQLDCVRLLLPFCDPLHCNTHGRYALMLAVEARNAYAVEYLLPRSNCTQRDRFRRTLFDVLLHQEPAEDEETELSDAELPPLGSREPDFWACADLLCVHLNPPSSMQVYQQAPPGLMPRFTAKIEHEKLERLLRPHTQEKAGPFSPPLETSSHHKASGPKTTDSDAPAPPLASPSRTRPLSRL